MMTKTVDLVAQAMLAQDPYEPRWVSDTFRDLNARRAARGQPPLEPLECSPTTRLTQVAITYGRGVR